MLQQAVNSATLHKTAVYDAVSGIFDVSGWTGFGPSGGFTKNRTNLEHVYDYYANLYASNRATTGVEHLYWAGMAKLAGATVYAGLEDIVESRIYLENAAFLTTPSSALWWISPDAYNAKLAKAALYSGMAATLGVVEQTLVQTCKDIFIDMSYMHEAYKNDGLYAIEELYFRPNSYAADTQIVRGIYEAWVKIDTGGTADIQAGNTALLRREQEIVVASGYTAIDRLIPLVRTGGGIPMGALAVSPIPTGNSFWSYDWPHHLGDNLANFTQRWAWITTDMLPHYLSMTPIARTSLIATSLPTLSAAVHTKAPLLTILLISALGI